MNARTLLFAAAALAPFALGAHAPASRLRFAPQEGSSLTKTFESKATLSLDDLTVTGTGGQTPDMEMTMTLHQKVVVTDQYSKMREGAPQNLVRTFDEMSGEQNASMKQTLMGESRTHDQNMRAKSELEGKKVVFDWDASEKAWKKTFDPSQEEDEILEGLEENMDLRQVLPATDVGEGDEWDIPLTGLRDFFAPGGNLGMVPENTDASAMKMGVEGSSLSEMIGDKLEGTAKAKLEGIDTVEGVKYVRVRLTIDVKSKADMTEAARKKIKGEDVPAGFELDHLKVDFGFEGGGELVWDLQSNHFRSLDLSGQMSIRTDNTIRLEMQGKKIEVNQTMAFSGRSTYTAKAR